MPKTPWRRQRSKIFCNKLLYNRKGSMTHSKNHTHIKQLCACVSETTLVGQLASRCRKSQEGKKSHLWRKVRLNPKVGTGPQGQTDAIALVLMSVAVWFSFVFLFNFVLKQSRPILNFRKISTFLGWRVEFVFGHTATCSGRIFTNLQV